MTNDIKEVKEAVIEKALNDMDVLAKEEKEIFRVDTDTFLFSGVEYKLIEEYKDAFDLEMMEERYTDYLLKYDYIVGDIAYEKLRLRGFYEDHRKGVPIDMKISNLEDYLIEYCSFGAAYFVFERVDKKEEDPESYFKRTNKQGPSRKKGSRNNRSNPRGRQNQPSKNTQTKQTKPRQKQKQSNKQTTNQNKNKNTNQNKKQTANQKQNQKSNEVKNKQHTKKAKDFQVVKKQESKPVPSNEPKKTITTKKTSNNKNFKIRKKKSDD